MRERTPIAELVFRPRVPAGNVIVVSEVPWRAGRDQAADRLVGDTLGEDAVRASSAADAAGGDPRCPESASIAVTASVLRAPRRVLHVTSAVGAAVAGVRGAREERLAAAIARPLLGVEASESTR